jgi:hypothetical protein
LINARDAGEETPAFEAGGVEKRDTGFIVAEN